MDEFKATKYAGITVSEHGASKFIPFNKIDYIVYSTDGQSFHAAGGTNDPRHVIVYTGSMYHFLSSGNYVEALKLVEKIKGALVGYASM